MQMKETIIYVYLYHSLQECHVQKEFAITNFTSAPFLLHINSTYGANALVVAQCVALVHSTK